MGRGAESLGGKGVVLGGAAVSTEAQQAGVGGGAPREPSSLGNPFFPPSGESACLFSLGDLGLSCKAVFNLKKKKCSNSEIHLFCSVLWVMMTARSHVRHSGDRSLPSGPQILSGVSSLVTPSPPRPTVLSAALVRPLPKWPVPGSCQLHLRAIRVAGCIRGSFLSSDPLHGHDRVH